MVLHTEQNPKTVLNLKEWPVKRNLNSDCSAFRKHLNAWVKQRKAIQDGPCKDESLTDIPKMSPPSPVIMSIDEEGEPVYKRSVVQMKRDALEYGNKIIAWDRAPDKGYALL
jgi:hypothetical protein